MTEMKAALTQLKESAAADARFKAALKHNTVGDTQKLQTALAGLVHVSARATLTTAGWPGRFLRDCLCSQARELLKVALGVPGLKDNIRGALQKKLDMTDARLTELEPMIAQHGLTLPTNAAAAHAAKSVAAHAAAALPGTAGVCEQAPALVHVAAESSGATVAQAVAAVASQLSLSWRQCRQGRLSPLGEYLDISKPKSRKSCGGTALVLAAARAILASSGVRSACPPSASGSTVK